MHKDWAIQRMSQGKNYVIEVVDSQIYFAPSRFVGYVDNTMEKHDANPGNGTETDNKIKNFYQKVQDVKLDALLQKAMSEYGIVVGAKKYWISKDTTVDDILSCSAVKVRNQRKKCYAKHFQRRSQRQHPSDANHRYLQISEKGQKYYCGLVCTRKNKK